MAVIQLIVALVVLGILYRRMIARDPEPIAKPQTIVPVVLGVVSLPLSLLILAAVGSLLNYIGYSGAGQPVLLRSLTLGLFMAGLNEELAKLLMMLLAFCIFRSGIRNVYECILIGVAVGFGFTLFEEFVYGSSLLVLVVRLFTVAAHVCFGIVMSKHLGMARYKKLNGYGSGAVLAEYCMAIAIPILIHSLFDACTGTNRMLDSPSEEVQFAGIILGLGGTVVMIILQIVMLLRLKKDAGKYCSMQI